MDTTLGILAHVDAGKTTLSEQLLYHSGVLRTPGRVDQKNAFLDYGTIERERGITIFSDQAVFETGERKFQLVDTPGHVDFSGEMERCLQILDCAVLVISCVEGIQSHTETIWRLLREKSIPTFLFLNKTDRVGADPEKLLKDISKTWKISAPNFTGRFHDGEMDPRLAEELAELDGELLEHYLADEYDKNLWLTAARRMIADCRLYPVFQGSALNGEGIEEFLRLLAALAPGWEGNPEAPLETLAYKVRHEKNGGRVVYFKVINGVLHPKMSVNYQVAGETYTEKANELRCYNAGRYTPMETAGPGALCGVTGLSRLMPGVRIGGTAEKTHFTVTPLLSSRVLFDKAVSAKTMLECFRILEDEEPLLGVEWNEELKEIEVHVMGSIQLEVLTQELEERFGYHVTFGPCRILYKETIAAPANGCGHFEPLRHYAEVHLRLAPAERGSGISFESACSTDELSENWQNLVKTHVFEKEHRGVLTGSPLTDISVTLTAGRAHLKHTEGGDFREATYRAIRQGLMRAESVLLEPYYAFTIQADLSLAGRILSDLQRMNSVCEPPNADENLVTVNGRAPVACLMDYPQEFAVLTKGRGKLSLKFDGYEPCYNAKAVIEEKGYEPERDLANTPDSVFCSHGAGYPVKWYEAEAHMHIKMK